MGEMWLPCPGSPIGCDALTSESAKRLWRALHSKPYARAMECRRLGDCDVVVMEVDVELGQIRVVDIARIERIAVVCSPRDDQMPEVLALRANFPQVPHLNLGDQNAPRSLCLYDQPWSEVRSHWTAAAFIETIRWWLAQTAKGRLHAEDQRLEPLILGVTDSIVLPHELFESDVGAHAECLAVKIIDESHGCRVLATRRLGGELTDGEWLAIAAVVVGAPQVHGIIRHKPQTVEELHDLVSAAHIDLLSQLRGALWKWSEQQTDETRATFLGARLILIAALPKARRESTAPEENEVWAFLTRQSVADVGADVGAWDIHNGKTGRLLQPPPDKVGRNTPLDVLCPQLTLSRGAAARCNGLEEPVGTRIVAIGAGALGSQVIDHCARSGFGAWTVVDNDRLWPHNVARHRLAASDVGHHKARAMCAAANALTASADEFRAVVADVEQANGNNCELTERMDAAELVLDMSASVAVSRFLARDVRSVARRVSVFTTPSGRDLVLLMEDAARQVRLDSLEMQYYRAIATDSRLSGHLDVAVERYHYGRSCRDISSRIPQTLVGLHAAIAAHELRRRTGGPTAVISIWSATPDMSVARVDVQIASVVEQRVGAWTLVTDVGLLNQLAGLRMSRLPNETGGILLGAFDTHRQLVYIAHSIPSPADSTERVSRYERGCRDVDLQVQSVNKRTAGMLNYVGEWHSHPDGYCSRPSEDDLRLFCWLREVMGEHGLPGVMMIVGETEQRALIGDGAPDQGVLRQGPRQ
jgi:integrative and conjugative element protein (TIGR02256 family)